MNFENKREIDTILLAGVVIVDVAFQLVLDKEFDNNLLNRSGKTFVEMEGEIKTMVWLGLICCKALSTIDKWMGMVCVCLCVLSIYMVHGMAHVFLAYGKIWKIQSIFICIADNASFQ